MKQRDEHTASRCADRMAQRDGAAIHVDRGGVQLKFFQNATRLGRERGWSPMDREHYEMMRSPEGSLLVGSPQQVIDKILYEHSLFQHTRFLAQMSVGTMPHSKMMRSIELFGTQVAPAVRKALQP